MFNDHMHSYVPDRGHNTLQSCLVLGLSLASEKPAMIILGGIELQLGLAHTNVEGENEQEWTPFAADDGPGPRGWHRNTQPVSSFMTYAGPRNDPSASYRTVVLGGAVYKLVSLGMAGEGDVDRYEVIVKFTYVSGAGEIDYQFSDYTLSGDLQGHAERVFRITLAGSPNRGASGMGWAVVGAQGVEFQEPQEEAAAVGQGEIVEKVIEEVS